MDTTGTSHDVVAALIARLRPALATGTVRQSELDACLTAISASHSARKEAMHALHDAGVAVVLDVQSPAPAADSVDAAVAAQDPCEPRDAGRDRLAADRWIRANRRAKRILTAEEEVGLTLLARPDGAPLPAGGFAGLKGESREAAEAMVLHNTGLVHRQAHKLVGLGLEYDDLVASGFSGLSRAIELFDPSRGLKFSTYAVHWIRQAMSRAIDDEARLIRLPVHVCEMVRKVDRVRSRLLGEGKAARNIDIARECDISVEKVEELRRLATAVLHLETPLGNDGFTLLDAVERPERRDEDVDVHGLSSDDLPDLLGSLTSRESDVLRRRFGMAPYGEPQTLEEIGEDIGVTRERVRQIQNKAFDRTRDQLRRRGWQIPDPSSPTAKQASAHESTDVVGLYDAVDVA